MSRRALGAFALCMMVCTGLNLSAAEPEATPAADLKLLPGFQAELLYSVPSESQGSWVSLTVDDEGRLITSDQYGKLYRVTPPPIGSGQQAAVEPIDVELGMAQGLLYAFDSLYVVVNGKGSGLYRVTDENGDDKFDKVTLLRAINGGGEHGPHAVILSPDGKSLYVCGGNHTEIPAPEKSRVPRNWQEDQLLNRMWDARGHAAGKLAPGGWICRTDPEGKSFELVSIGFRNEYDIAFNLEGDLFTYDADMEWDVGTPWYRPTRVNHVISGAEFGWRSGTGKWPTWYPDSLPSVVDVGPGSPTGITFGTGAKFFPPKYQRALFISDWSYGVIYAVHLEPSGSTYTGELERFVSAAPMPATDIVINPKDGAFYFTIGGRRTQSGLYRITYNGPELTKPVTTGVAAGSELRATRRMLEALHVPNADGGVAAAWPYLGHKDRYIRYAARVALEHQPVASWLDKALAEEDPDTLIGAMIALARNGEPALQAKAIAALGRLPIGQLSERQQLDLLRTYSLLLIRMKEAETPQIRQSVLARLDPLYPARSSRLNRELALLLVYLEAPGVAERTLALQAKAPTQEEQIHYAYALKDLATGWTPATRETYYNWFLMAESHRGGASFGGFLKNIREESLKTLSDADRAALAEVLSRKPAARPVDLTLVNRPFVKKWTIDELVGPVNEGMQGRDFERGRRLFAETTCFKCHRFAGEGGTVGPDLTGAGRRFNTLNLLEAMIDPSKTISDQFAATMFVLNNGKTVVGRVANLNGDNIMVVENMLEPGNLTTVKRGQIEEQMESRTSMMPTGLLDTLTQDEILDLIAYLRSGGNADDPAFNR